MRGGRILLLCAAATVALAVPATAEAAEGARFAVQTKITSFAAVQGRLVANGTLAGSFSDGGETTWRRRRAESPRWRRETGRS